MPRMPTRIVGPVAIATGAATIYTVPAATQVVIRKIHIQNPSGSPVTVTLSIGTDAAGKRILDAYSIPAAGAGVATSVQDFYGPYTMVAGEILQAATGTNNIAVITIDADVYTAG